MEKKSKSNSHNNKLQPINELSRFAHSVTLRKINQIIKILYL